MKTIEFPQSEKSIKRLVYFSSELSEFERNKIEEKETLGRNSRLFKINTNVQSKFNIRQKKQKIL